MKTKAISVLLVLVLLMSLAGNCAYAASDKDLKENVPSSGITFNVLYSIFCKNIPSDLVTFICDKRIDTADCSFTNSSANEVDYYWLISNDTGCVQTVGYTLNSQNHFVYITRDVFCVHRHGEMIRFSVFYNMEGHYLGNIKWDLTNDNATSSSRCPYYVTQGICNLE